jgi:hypothetical protein
MDNIIIGDTLELEYTLDDYSASEYDIWIALRGPAQIDLKESETGVTITKDGDTFNITVTAAITGTWTAGDYWYSIYAGQSNFTTRHEAERGQVAIEDNRAAIATTYDDRSHAKKTLDAIEAVIEGRASQDQMSYTIAGRRLDKTDLEDLLMLRDYYRKEYNAELKQERVDRGDSPGNLIKVKL